jgi:hypothetical protein
MDIIKFVKRFLKAHKNSETDKMLNVLERDYTYAPRVIDSALLWQGTDEGFYYFYFLQIRLLLATALLLYEDGEFDKCWTAIEKGQEIIGYSDVYKGLCVSRKMPITEAEYWRYKNYYKNRFQKIADLLNEKNS